MLKIDSPIFLQNINMLARQLFLLFKKSTTFWDNPRICWHDERDTAIYVKKTKVTRQLICAFVFLYAISRFSHDVAEIEVSVLL